MEKIDKCPTINESESMMLWANLDSELIMLAIHHTTITLNWFQFEELKKLINVEVDFGWDEEIKYEFGEEDEDEEGEYVEEETGSSLKLVKKTNINDLCDENKTNAFI